MSLSEFERVDYNRSRGGRTPPNGRDLDDRFLVTFSSEATRPGKTVDANQALAKLARLRLQVGRCKGLGPIFKKLRSSDLEKALTFLDDRLLGSTSNAVERGNRRHRKMQKTVYRVRTHATISGRIALDMFREAQGPSREQTMKALHHTRRH